MKRPVEMHGRTVTVHSEGPGQGTEFVVRLPAIAGGRVEGCGPTRLSRRKADREPARRRILVVDDNRDAADSLAKYLDRVMGQQVEVAYDGPAAVEVAASFRPEVVLLDIGLPGMDGYEVAVRLRGGTETGEAMLIALTGWGQDEDRRRSKAAGIDFHLVKPVDLDALGDLLAGAGSIAGAGTAG